MRFLTCTTLAILLSSALCSGAEARERDGAIELSVPVPSAYYWQTTTVSSGAELLTLFCRTCSTAPSQGSSLPLISVLRDSLGDDSRETDRLADIWLLTYHRSNIGRQLLSAVPFFYWRIGNGSADTNGKNIRPLLDLTAPQHPVLAQVGRDLIQWTLLDGTPLRASTRAYQSNGTDLERLQLEETIDDLRQAPASDEPGDLTEAQINALIARLELRKTLLGGLVDERYTARIGQEAGFEEQRTRTRNWELLRQWADKTGLYFEPLDLAGTKGEYAMLWLPLDGSFPPVKGQLGPVWKLLNIKDPRQRNSLGLPAGSSYSRTLDEQGQLLPLGVTGATSVQMTPVSVYSLSYPRMPLLLLDYQSRLHVRWHEMTQRTINEVTAGVIGISHFTNWYFYIAADAYDFIAERHGSSTNQAARLDCYSAFRQRLSLDRQQDTRLRSDMQERLKVLELNPLETSPVKDQSTAMAYYRKLQESTVPGGKLDVKVWQGRGAELTQFKDSKKQLVIDNVLHAATLGTYTHRASASQTNFAAIDSARRIEYQLNFLEVLTNNGAAPEIAYDRVRIQGAVAEVSRLLPQLGSPLLRERASEVLGRLKELSGDSELRADCSAAVAALQPHTGDLRDGVAARPKAVKVAAAGAPAATPPLTLAAIDGLQ